MTEEERQCFECEVLLRASGELPKERFVALGKVTSQDEQLAEFARFVENELNGLTSAPRNFAAEAITRSLIKSKPVFFKDFPRLLIGMAALVAMGGLLLVLIITGSDAEVAKNSKLVDAHGDYPRSTCTISRVGSELESELTSVREVINRSRFSTSETL